MPPKTTLWELDEHTVGKHIVLRSYLNAWLPILGTTEKQILFVDGFAGPGQYAGGEDGSPIIALKALENHRAREKMIEVNFWFLEENAAREEHLRSLVVPFQERLKNVKIVVERGTCAERLLQLLDEQGTLPPAFVMLDPFGVSDTPMSLIYRLLRGRKVELFISVMWQYINRFKERPEFEGQLDQLIGSRAWRKLVDLPLQERKARFYALYERQLRRAGAKHVTYFELYNGKSHIYTIFFATKSPKGMDRMKQAIWKADSTGDFAFRGRWNDAYAPFIYEMLNQTRLEDEMRIAFGERWVTIDDLLRWAETDKTDFHSGQIRSALIRVEEAGGLDVIPISEKKRRPRTYPSGTRIRFRSRNEMRPNT